MSYQVLARKWRPKTFREMVGQEHVLKALINALDHNRLHHAYLFTGTRGVGKTTIARILAKCLNCEAGVSSEPCGQCSACVSIAEGRFIDLLEVDAASRTKVEDTRELLENVQYAPTSGRYKIYLIDEVHMLSTHSFNALLKTLEEPPPHVKFLLATTDPQKLPATILSRCLQFNLKNMSPERIVGHLQYVLEQEMVSFEEPALWLLGRAADGSMRDAMSLTDQAIAFGSGKLLEADVGTMLGTIDQSSVFGIFEALAQADGAGLLAAVEQMSQHAPDFISALEALLTLLHRVAIAQAVPDATDNSFGDREKITELAGRLAAEDVQLFYQLALNGRRDLPLAPDPRSGFEMVLLRMLAFKPAGISELPQAALQNSAVASTVPETAVTARAAEVPSQPVKKPEAAASAQQSANKKDPSVETNLPLAAQTVTKPEASALATPEQPVIERRIESPVATEIPASVKPPIGSPVNEVAPLSDAPTASHVITSTPLDNAVGQSQTVASSTAKPAAKLTLETLSPATWNSGFEQLDFGGVVGNIASHCVLQRVSGDNIYLLLDEKNATLFNDTYTDRIQAHLSIALNAPINVIISVQAVNTETPALLKMRMIKERKQQALLSIQNDPNVQLLVNEFDAQLDVESVQPTD